MKNASKVDEENLLWNPQTMFLMSLNKKLKDL